MKSTLITFQLTTVFEESNYNYKLNYATGFNISTLNSTKYCDKISLNFGFKDLKFEKKYMILYFFIRSILNTARVQHHTDFAADGCRRQVLLELGTDGADATMCTGDLAPNNAVHAAFLEGLSLIDICETFAKVEFCLSLGLYTSNLHKSSVIILVRFASFVSQELSGDI